MAFGPVGGRAPQLHMLAAAGDFGDSDRKSSTADRRTVWKTHKKTTIYG
jgi:hypothetical protein